MSVCLLDYDSICIAVYNTHPKYNFKLIEKYILQHQSGTMRLAGFSMFDCETRYTICRLSKDSGEVMIMVSMLTKKISNVVLRILNNWGNKNP